MIDDQAWLEDDFIPTVQKRGAAIIQAVASARPSAASAAIVACTTGNSARPTATGCRWRSRTTAATACPRASSRRSPSPAPVASTASCRVSRSTTSRRVASMRPQLKLVAERDTVSGLGLIGRIHRRPSGRPRRWSAPSTTWRRRRGCAALERGGSAVDAAIAANAVLAIVAAHVRPRWRPVGAHP